jgi:carboxylesterase type B
MVWICGRGFNQGSIKDRQFNSSYIVQTSILINKPVIIVSINYGLSAMAGSLASKSSHKEKRILDSVANGKRWSG